MVEEAPNSQEPSSGIVVGTSKSSHRRYFWHRQRKLIVAIVLIALLLISGALYVMTRIGNNDNSETSTNVLVISGYGNTVKVSKDQYAQLTRQATESKIVATSARQTIIEAGERKIAAQHLDITIDSENISTVSKTLYGKSNVSELNDWQLLTSYDGAVKNNVLFRQRGEYKGTIFFFPFNRLFINPLAGAYIPPGYGDPQAVALDKAYAFEQATSYRNNLKAGKTTVGLVLKAINNEPRFEFAGGSNDSYSFYVDTGGYAYLNGDTTVTKIPNFALADIKTMQRKGITDIKIMTNEYSGNVLAPGFSSPSEVAYYFVDISDVIVPKKNFANQFESALKEIKVIKNEIK
jgi:hypothetical protein